MEPLRIGYFRPILIRRGTDSSNKEWRFNTVYWGASRMEDLFYYILLLGDAYQKNWDEKPKSGGFCPGLAMYIYIYTTGYNIYICVWSTISDLVLHLKVVD